MELVRGGRTAPLAADSGSIGSRVHSAVVSERTLDLTGPMAGSRCGETRGEAVPDQRVVPRIATGAAGTGEARRGASCAGFASGAWSSAPAVPAWQGARTAAPRPGPDIEGQRSRARLSERQQARAPAAERRQALERPQPGALSPSTRRRPPEPPLDGAGAGSGAGDRRHRADRDPGGQLERPVRPPGRASRPATRPSATAISPTRCRPPGRRAAPTPTTSGISTHRASRAGRRSTSAPGPLPRRRAKRRRPRSPPSANRSRRRTTSARRPRPRSRGRRWRTATP